MASEEGYHQDATCGCCQGPLEWSRDAVCKTCVPDSVFWQEGIAMELHSAAGDKEQRP